MPEHIPTPKQVLSQAEIKNQSKEKTYIKTAIMKALELLHRRSWQIVGILVVTVFIGLLAGSFLPSHMAVVAALTVFCIGFWATAVVPEYWPAFAFFLLAVVFELAPAQTVFSGFHSSTFWLLFSGLILGASIRYTGLGRRAAVVLSSMLGASYFSVIVGVVTFSLVLAFILPSAMGRIVLLVPIVIALAEHMDYRTDSNGRTGMLMGAAFGTCLPAFAILPANAPNMILAGMTETLYGEQLAYWDYLLLHFPVLGILKAVFLIGLILWMFPDHAPKTNTSNSQSSEGEVVSSEEHSSYQTHPYNQERPSTKKDPSSQERPSEQKNKSVKNTDGMSQQEWHLTLLIGLCLVLWFTDGLHHISPGWIGLAAALYCLWPGSKLISKNCLNEDIKYAPLFFVAGIMGLGAVISTSGLGEVVVQSLSELAGFSTDQPFWNITALTIISTLVAMVTNLPSVPAVMTPIAENLSEITGLPLVTVLMTQVLAFSNVFLPYQAPPLITAMQVGQLSARSVTRLCLALFACSVLILTPLDLLWWYFLGMV